MHMRIPSLVINAHNFVPSVHVRSKPTMPSTYIQPGAEVEQVGGNWCMHSMPVNTEFPTVGVLSWVIPTQCLLFYAKRSHTSAEHTQNCC